jgi:hypothetical protein
MFSTNRTPILNRHQYYLQMDQNEIPHDPRHLGVLSGASKMILWGYGTFGTYRAPILCQDYHYLRTDWIELPLEHHHLRVSSGASKMISEALVHLAQTMHLSWVKISTISNTLNQASTWASSPRSTIGCVQNDFWANGLFSTKRAPILNRHQHYR